MDVIETVYTDAQFHDLGTISDSGLNVAYGGDDNDFEVTTFADVDIPDGGLVYARIRRNGKLVGTEYGGMVTKRNPHADSNGKAVVTYGGASWHGILNDHVICPPSGSAYLHVTGEANAAIGTVLSALGLTELFAASGEQSGITVGHDFRYAAGYDGLTAMLSEAGAKLKMAFDGSHVVLSAVAIHDYSADAEFDQSQVHLNLKIDGNPVNHLICMGTGEGVDRIRVDLYADASGNVSTTQTQFGLAEHAEEYDYTSADLDTLTTDGTKKLQDYQDAATTIEVTVEPSLTEFDVGDIIGAIARSGNTIDTVSAYVTYKSATVNGQHLDVTYKAGTVLKTTEEQAAQTQTAQSIAALNEALAAHTTATDAKQKAEEAVVDTYDEYAVSASSDTAPTSGWSSEQPTKTPSNFIWRRVVSVYGDGSKQRGSPAVMTGNSGEDATLVRVDSSRGLVFKNSVISTMLEAVIFHGSQRITDIETLHSVYGASAYIEWSWRRIDDTAFGVILSTDPRITDSGFSFSVSPDDVDIKTVFQATLHT